MINMTNVNAVSNETEPSMYGPCGGSPWRQQLYVHKLHSPIGCIMYSESTSFRRTPPHHFVPTANSSLLLALAPRYREPHEGA